MRCDQCGGSGYEESVELDKSCVACNGWGKLNVVPLNDVSINPALARRKLVGFVETDFLDGCVITSPVYEGEMIPPNHANRRFYPVSNLETVGEQ
jgi:hypothetical protein